MVALDDEGHVEEMRNLYREKRDILLEALRGAGLDARESEATFYIWQKVPSGMNDVEFAEKLLDPEIAIVVTPGSLISDDCEVRRDGAVNLINPGEGYVRFALMPTMEEMGEVGERLKKL